jgi:hypothetical protein
MKATLKLAALKSAGISMVVAATTAMAIVADAQAANVDRRVNAYSSNSYTYQVFAGERLSVRLRGDGDTDLDLVVRDPFGRTVCISDGRSDRESCWLTASDSGRYRIEVKNLGDVYNNFSLAVN